ncbi:hypothetical protein L1D54_10465 [Vibrio brasiliensis]|uniref:Uncharacterized protein n=1 Tax=Vibrio brasiliensis LMG 20546 TaxID=945543 RepID=E8LQI8_9VIBR|nr:hypothetical protein [Vibrio brasiliensis]EGA67029.1 hypothetical protein VIBR0546_11452 [Vibrio brasiliensis LMG 20546]MCG9648202.1 hypothetical protein [Vibrio brasiliensis]MCG9726953.1 hypothetical protein [Vibrio brasiliensis]MCG9750903.1 hypothetical protein [Vibrio brasiliensis]MCG9783825.1 hypothetical protein [Vibrio brasiliensis]
MKGDISYQYGLEPYLIVRYNYMTPQQFEIMKAQLKSLTPQQLRTLRGEINSELDSNDETVVTDEELSLISSLFS